MLLKNVELDGFKSVILNKKTDLSTIQKNKNEFLEMIIPFDSFSLELLDQLNVDRVIIQFDNQEQLEQQDHIFAQLISKKLYPFTRGVPFCHGNIEHTIEVFKRVEGPAKPTVCSKCLLATYCPFSGTGFTPRPITNTKEVQDLLEFIENEDPTTRF